VVFFRPGGARPHGHAVQLVAGDLQDGGAEVARDAVIPRRAWQQAGQEAIEPLTPRRVAVIIDTPDVWRS